MSFLPEILFVIYRRIAGRWEFEAIFFTRAKADEYLEHKEPRVYMLQETHRADAARLLAGGGE